MRRAFRVSGGVCAIDDDPRTGRASSIQGEGLMMHALRAVFFLLAMAAVPAHAGSWQSRRYGCRLAGSTRSSGS
jgi:hypothetical protein